MTWEAIAALSALAVTLLTGIGFIANLLSAEREKGRTAQRIDEMEKKLSDHEKRLELNDNAHNSEAVALARITDAVEYIKRRLDEISDKQEKQGEMIQRLAGKIE